MRRLLSACGAMVLIACNALSGANDLAVCEGASCASSSGSDSGAPALPDGASADGAAASPTCAEGEKRCAGRMAEACAGGAWNETPCAETCQDGVCVPWPSCRAPSGATCGAGGTSCCEAKVVPGGVFDRRNDDGYPATVSAFSLDVYEVSVGRFRAFVEAGAGTQAKPPSPGAGGHPKIAESGWNDAWTTLLPPSASDLRELVAGGTWTDAPEANEKKPITNVSWFVAFAFCAWDGGRLPTYAEWSFAAAGGDEQRYYPWSSPPANPDISPGRAAYSCNYSEPAYTCPPAYCSVGNTTPCDQAACLAAAGTCVTPSCFGCDIAKDVADVGVLPSGAGRWGHFDLGGNASEMVFDAFREKSGPGNDDPLIVPCVDCASLMPPDPARSGSGPSGKKDAEFFVAGGAWDDSELAARTSSYFRRRWDQRSTATGFRCARD